MKQTIFEYLAFYEFKKNRNVGIPICQIRIKQDI